MKNNKFKVGQKVEDSWYGEAGIGIIKSILKTQMKIYFRRLDVDHVVCPLTRNSVDGMLTYDRSHYQFLKPIT
jgi:hypothetical protein